ncbi:MAG: glycosyltransferase [Chloroflexota bacterium]|nr:glycosyltransferase [Chloroflexota bacterium]
MHRILYFSRDYTTHDHRFLSALAKTEHEVFYLRLERGDQQLEARPLPPGIESISWTGGRGAVDFKDISILLSDLARVIEQVKPDLIQAGPIQRSAFLVALLGFQPLISVSWGYDLIHDAEINTMWRWNTRFTLKQSAVMVGDCDTIRKLAISYGMPDERIVTFPWGVDLNHFTPNSNEAEAADKPFRLLSTRSWEPIYGVDVIAQAFVQAANELPDLRLVMLGEGPMANYLHTIFKEGGVFERVLFPGLAPYDDLPEYYRAADLYLSASHSDGTSISLLEALACGIPALVSNIPGNREWIQPGEQGWLFTDGDSDALAQAILNAADQRHQLPEMGHAARTLAEQRANWDLNFQKLLKAYSLALSA